MLKGMPEKCEVMLGVKCFVYHIQNTGGWEEEGGGVEMLFIVYKPTLLCMYVVLYI